MAQEHILGFDSGISASIKGRFLLADVKDASGVVLFKKGHLLTKTDAEKIEAAGLLNIHVRTPLTCQCLRGICRTCYGEDPGRGGLIKTGEPVGIVAAQAIGEPGTQLTMRTKHAGGVGGAGGDIVGGLPRVEEIFERRSPKNPCVICEVDGEVMEVKSDSKGHTITILVDISSKKKNAKGSTIEYTAPISRSVNVKKGEQVHRGDILTDGSADIVDYYNMAGRKKVEDYIIKEINSIYELQGVSIARKHIELMIRQMFSRRRVKESGDTKFTVGEIIEAVELVEENDAISGDKATGEQIALGISEVALSTSSFLSAVSFQHATRVLIEAAIKGSVDKLRGLKENVIIGRLIPAGTGLMPDFDPVSSRENTDFN
jgi:DNA-directed RNA polymerase subunit beta'